MTEIRNNQTLNSHYSTSSKVEKPERVVVNGPNALPNTHVFNDKDAKRRLKAINQDIYVDYKKEQGRDKKTFIKYFLGFVAIILAACGIKRFFK